jgi:parallel beta-helix repeat protein
VRKSGTLIITIVVLFSVTLIYSHVEGKVTVNSVIVTTDKGEYTLGSEAIAKAQLDYTGSKKDLLGVNFTWYYPNASIAKLDLNVMPDGSGAAYSSWWPDVVGSPFSVKAVYSGDESKFHETTFSVVSAPPSNITGGAIGIDTIWTVAQSPYIVIDDVFVESGVILTIEPGVVVEFTNDTYLMVNGTLNAQGNELNMITFTSNETDPKPGDWDGIDFNSADSNSILSFSRIEYAYKGIVIYDSSPEISYNLIRDINRSGIEVQMSSSYIHNNTITKIVYGYASNKGINLISECDVIIENNIISEVQEYGIKVYNSDPEIRGNYISGSTYNIECTNSNASIISNYLFNAVNAIRLVSCPDTYIGYNDITGCSGYGIRVERSSPKIEKNKILENEDSGIWLYICDDVDISGNQITYNEYGVDVHKGSGFGFENNLIKSNRKSGIHSENAQDISISENNIDGNENGIHLKDTVNISLIENLFMENHEKGLFFYNCSNTEIISDNYTENKIGIYLVLSDSVISNTTLYDSSERDIYLTSNCHVQSINSTFASNVLVSSDSELIVKNYLHIIVQNETYKPLMNIEFEIIDNEVRTFSHHTDGNGYFGFILVTDRVYSGGNVPYENITLINLTEELHIFMENPREVDMSISHTEFFGPGNPLSITIITPVNDTLIFDKINITGSAGFTGQDDVVVMISIDGGEWIFANYTGDNWTSWWVELDTSLLSDGEHVINARIISEFFQKEESILILVDNEGNKPPQLTVDSHKSGDRVSGIVTIEGTALDHDGLIESVAVKVNSDEWVVANNLGGDWNKWSFSFGSADYPNGTHIITITAIDNSSESTFSDLDLFFENEHITEKPVEDEEEFSYLPLLAVIIPLLLCVIMFLVIKRKKDRELKERYSEEEKGSENGSS